MNSDLKKLSRNTVYTFTSNIIAFIVNAMVVLIIPKLIGVSEYGYFQLYMLLATYALYFHFGWCDGVYLIYVGKDYKNLDKELMSSQFKGLILMSLLVSVLLTLGACLFCNDRDKLYVYCVTAIVVFFVTPKTFTSVVMQMTNQMKRYSQIVLIEKAVYTVILGFMLLIGIRNFKFLILADLTGKISALMLGIYFCRDIIKIKLNLNNISKYVSEAISDIKVGIFLLISNLASLLITGVVQFFVEWRWDIETFSKVSLTFNISKMLMVVITAMSIVLVPFLKNMNNQKLGGMYKIIRSVLMVTLGGVLIFYYPIKTILEFWLPQYSESLHYMALLFPMCLFESKTQLLLNTYLKAMREEKILCKVNFVTVFVAICITCVTVFAMKSINVAILTIPYLLAFRCICLERYIGERLNLKLLRDGFVEVLLSTIFIAVSWTMNSVWSMLLYIVAYLVYLCYARKQIQLVIFKFREMFNR